MLGFIVSKRKRIVKYRLTNAEKAHIIEKSSVKEAAARKRIEVVITGLTRNQVARKGSWVRIPPLPPDEVARMELSLPPFLSRKGDDGFDAGHEGGST